MPHIANTPESILPRSDSRNPAVTCWGITTNGRPCRRALGSSSTPLPSSTPAKGGSRLQDMEVNALYCWQHKDQAVSYANGRDDSLRLNQRSSMDTVMDRLGILDIDEKKNAKKKREARSSRKHRPQRTFCCFAIEDDEESRPSKPVRSYVSNPEDERSSSQHRPGQNQGPGRHPVPHRTVPTPKPGNSQQQKRNSSRPQPTTTQRNRNTSQTQSLLSWVPSTLSPQTTSLLLTELAKPISDADETGYIYMFWVTPSSPSPPPPDIASSLFPPTPTQSQSPKHRRSVSDAIRAADGLNALASKPSNKTPGTIRLKIGRTSNVQRRLNEWTRQCSHNLTLIRYYPYTPSTPSLSPGRNCSAQLEPGRKVPHVHRVERLIHIELNDIRVRDLERCGECNRTHREWFEIAAEKDQLRRVEECIRRWVRWGESQESQE